MQISRGTLLWPICGNDLDWVLNFLSSSVSSLPLSFHSSTFPLSLSLSLSLIHFSLSLSPPSSSKLCSFWMSRFYERSDKEKGGMKGREGRRGGGQRGTEVKKRGRGREEDRKKWKQEWAWSLLHQIGYCPTFLWHKMSVPSCLKVHLIWNFQAHSWGGKNSTVTSETIHFKTRIQPFYTDLIS